MLLSSVFFLFQTCSSLLLSLYLMTTHWVYDFYLTIYNFFYFEYQYSNSLSRATVLVGKKNRMLTTLYLFFISSVFTYRSCKRSNKVNMFPSPPERSPRNGFTNFRLHRMPGPFFGSISTQMDKLGGEVCITIVPLHTKSTSSVEQEPFRDVLQNC